MNDTLLDIVRTILNDMDGDEINSISDTAEAEQVANIVRRTYYSLMSNSVWPHTRRAISLVSFSDSAYPTHMSLPENVKQLISINYNVAEVDDTRKIYKQCTYLDPDDFLRKLNKRDDSKSNVDIIVDTSGIDLMIINDKHPEYFTSFNDKDLVFDSYDNEVDSVLQESKVQAQAYIIPELLLEDSAVPDLPPDVFALLIEEATSRCQIKLREFQDVKSESESQRQRRWVSRKAWRVNGGIKYPNYGKVNRG